MSVLQRTESMDSSKQPHNVNITQILLKQREKFSQRVEATKPHGGESGLLNSS
jgi:hypothetical protein